MAVLKPIAMTCYLVLLILAAGLGIDRASEGKMLIPFAFPLAVFLILALRVFGGKSELAGWAIFTVWLGITYLQTGNVLEIIAFGVYLVFALLGAFKSPYFLAFAWCFHPVWDFIPRELPDLLKDLPTACILFDIPIGLYILWHTRQGRWLTFGRKNNTPLARV
jgi:hypothetical protein